MPDVISRQLRVVLCAALLLPLWTQAQAEDWYKVELLVFSNLAGGAAESWDALPELSYPDATTYLSAPEQRGVDTLQGEQSPSAPASEQLPPVVVRSNRAPYLTLPTAQLEFAGAAARMKRSGRYRVLFHQAWTQPIGRRSEAVPVVLDRSGDDGYWPSLQGTITLYIARYIYLETNLWLNTAGDYLPGSWQMPPPPLGPPTTALVGARPTANGSVSNDAMEAEKGPVQPQTRESVLSRGSQGPEYPYRHAVALHKTHRMRSTEVNYIDHPMLGVVVKVTPLPPDSPASTVPAAGPGGATPSQ